MSFFPLDEVKTKASINFAPMIDFLFLLLAFFACLAVSRITTKDTDIELVKILPEKANHQTNADLDYKLVNISITDQGNYKWVTEIRDYTLSSSEEISSELIRQYDKGLLPEDKLKTQVLLKIDKGAAWDPILRAIFAIRDAGFEVRPLYEPEQIT